MAVDCESCRFGRSCVDMQVFYRRAFFAFAKGVPVECADYQEEPYRSAELPEVRRPHPSGAGELQGARARFVRQLRLLS